MIVSLSVKEVIVEGGSGVVQYIENFFLDRMWTQGCKENALNVNNFI